MPDNSKMTFVNSQLEIRIKPYDKQKYLITKELLENYSINTVCIEANCPNRYECFSKGTATFMILGKICTRNCFYCNIQKGIPKKVDNSEPKMVAEVIKKLKLDYVVITCVTRDDLKDSGAGHFVRTINEIRNTNPNCKIEVLISDLKGNWKELKKIIDAKPDILNHNMEVVKELFSKLRPKGNYILSLELLKKAKEFNPKLKTKSGFMLGFGESEDQINKTIKELKEVNCDIITLGQYLQPSKKHFKVKKYYTFEEFKKIKEKARQIGISNIIASPLVRSSYKANEISK